MRIGPPQTSGSSSQVCRISSTQGCLHAWVKGSDSSGWLAETNWHCSGVMAPSSPVQYLSMPLGASVFGGRVRLQSIKLSASFRKRNSSFCGLLVASVVPGPSKLNLKRPEGPDEWFSIFDSPRAGKNWRS